MGNNLKSLSRILVSMKLKIYDSSSKMLIGLLLYFSFCLKCFVVLFLPRRALSFAWDETAYSDLVLWASNSWNMRNFPNLGEGFYLSNKLITWVGVLFYRFVGDERLSVRLVALSFSGICFIAYYCALNILGLLKHHSNQVKLLLVLITTIYCFLPSGFVWSVLGMKEGVILSLFQVWIVSLIVLLKKSKSLGLLLANVVVILFVFTRLELVVIVMASTCSWLLWSLKQKYHDNSKLIVALTVSIFFTSIAANSLRMYDFSTPRATQDTNQTVKPTNNQQKGNSTSGEDEIHIGNVQDSSQIESDKRPANLLLSWNIGFVKRRLDNASENEGSSYRREVCGGFKQRLETVLDYADNTYSQVSFWEAHKSAVFCHFLDLPLQVFLFWFKPFPILDSDNRLQLFAGIENTFWIGFLLYSALFYYMFSKRRTKDSVESNPFRALESAIWFIVLMFILASSLYEGNMGSAYRHKIVLFPAVISLMIIMSVRLCENSKVGTKRN